MTDPSKTPKIENLELNKETLQELAESEAEAAQGGFGTAACTFTGDPAPASLRTCPPPAASAVGSCYQHSCDGYTC